MSANLPKFVSLKSKVNINIKTNHSISIASTLLV